MTPPEAKKPSVPKKAARARATKTQTKAATTDKSPSDDVPSLDESLLGVIDMLHDGVELSPAARKILSRATFSPETETRDILSRAMLLGAYPTPYLKQDYQLAFRRIVGEAMALAIRGDLQTAKKLLAKAEKFLADRTGETARMWYVQAIVVLLLLLYTLFPMLTSYFSDTVDKPNVKEKVLDAIIAAAVQLPSPEERSDFLERACGGNHALRLRLEVLLAAQQPILSAVDEREPPEVTAPPSGPPVAQPPEITPPPPIVVTPSTPAPDDKSKVTKESILQLTYYKINLYLLAILGGALGAGFSLLVRVGKLRIDPAVGRWSTYGEVAFRLTIGGLAGLIILFGMEADVIGGFLTVSSEDGLIDAALYARTFWIIGVFSIAAGASERLVPGLLEQLSDRTKVKSEDGNAAESASSTSDAKSDQ